MTLVLMALGGTVANPQHACRKITSLAAIDSVLVRYIASATQDNHNKKQRRQNGQLPHPARQFRAPRLQLQPQQQQLRYTLSSTSCLALGRTLTGSDVWCIATLHTSFVRHSWLGSNDTLCLAVSNTMDNCMYIKACI